MQIDDIGFLATAVAAGAILLGLGWQIVGWTQLLCPGTAWLPLLGNSSVATIGVGMLLSVTAILMTYGYGRAMGVVSFAALGVTSLPGVIAVDSLFVGQAAVAFVLALYLFRNPIRTQEHSSPVDETKSATRIGTTLR